MATSPHETKAALLEAIVARVRDDVEGAAADDVERFVRAYYAHVAPDDLIDRSADDLYGAALAHRSLARVRRPGELKLHVCATASSSSRATRAGRRWRAPHSATTSTRSRRR